MSSSPSVSSSVFALPLNPFQAAAARAVAAALGVEPELFAVSAPPRPDMGDIAVGCFPAAKALRQAPPKLAAAVVEAFAPTAELAAARAVGPFVNFDIQRGALLHHLFGATGAVATDAAPPLLPPVGDGKTVCIDYSSPNIAKQLAYHHIRSTVIGHALAQMYRGLGYRVVGINHLGDWGTTHGMLLAAAQMWGAPEPVTVAGLNALYVRFRDAMKHDETLAEAGRAWFKRLEDGDPAARASWQQFRDVSLAEFQQAYDLLGIEFDEVRGESEYLDAMPGVISMLADKNLSARSKGALVVPLDDEDLPPLLLEKQDGATLYSTRDLAAAIYRWEHYEFVRNLYVVDRGQGVHFRQLFATLRKAGYEWADRCHHVPFGLVRIGGKKTTTRGGNAVALNEVLREAQDRVLAIIADRVEDGDGAADIARDVGVGAVKFANLISQRDKDVDFSWEDVITLTGDSGVYIQYSHARCASVLRKGGGISRGPVDVDRLTTDAEWAVAKKLLELADVVNRGLANNEPHLVCRFLLDLCAVFSSWYAAGNDDKALRVLCDDPDTRAARLALTEATRTVLATGLGLLGIGAPDVM